MAAPSADPVPSPKAHFLSNPPRRTRVIAKFRSSLAGGVETSSGFSSNCISVEYPDAESKENPRICVLDGENRSEVFRLDSVYDQEDEIGCMFSKEIRPLLSQVFDGGNTTVFFYGGRNSGKTHTFMEISQLLIGEIFSMNEKSGLSVQISSYELLSDMHNERCYDLFGLGEKEVLVCEDKEGKIQLKGLTQIPVKSSAEFNKVFIDSTSSSKVIQKGSSSIPRKSHKGLMITLCSSSNEDCSQRVVGKMNFIDLAGHEDAKNIKNDCSRKIEAARINKSLLDLLKAIHGLEIGSTEIFWRESKLARILKDSLIGASQLLIVACLNLGSYQEAGYTLSSLSHQPSKVLFGGKETQTYKQHTPSRVNTMSNSVLRDKNIEKSGVSFSPLEPKAPLSTLRTPKSFRRRLQGELVSASKVTARISSKTSSRVNNRAKKNIVPDEVQNETEPLAVREGYCLQSNNEASRTIDISQNTEFSLCPSLSTMETVSELQNDLKQAPGNMIQTSSLEGNDGNKENESTPISFGENSPPITERLIAMDNNMRSFFTPSSCHTATPHIGYDDVTNCQIRRIPLEPITPKVTSSCKLMPSGSPFLNFSSRCSGMKESFLQEFLGFLNTASKEELMKIKGIGEKRAGYILELREESTQPFKELADLRNIGLYTRQVKSMLKTAAAQMFTDDGMLDCSSFS